MRNQLYAFGFAAAFCLSTVLTTVSQAALAKQSGGSGYSGTLSKNAKIKQQQVVQDPTALSSSTGPTFNGAPVRGSSSISYDPSIVTLSDIVMATGYDGSAFVEVECEGGPRLQDFKSFEADPEGPETGYAQVFFHHGCLPEGSEFPTDNLFGPPGQPTTISPNSGFTTTAIAGVNGFDTHSFFFTYLPETPPSTVATYTMYADAGCRPSGNTEDFLVSNTPNGGEFRVGHGDLSPATVSGNLVPLPPAVWGGSILLGLVALSTIARRRTPCRA